MILINYGIHGLYKPIYNWRAPHCSTKIPAASSFFMASHACLRSTITSKMSRQSAARRWRISPKRWNSRWKNCQKMSKFQRNMRRQGWKGLKRVISLMFVLITVLLWGRIKVWLVLVFHISLYIDFDRYSVYLPVYIYIYASVYIFFNLVVAFLLGMYSDFSGKHATS